jgi:hypothetical protein
LSCAVAGAGGRMHVFAQVTVAQYTEPIFPFGQFVIWELHAVTMRANGTFSGESVVIPASALANGGAAPFAIGPGCLDGAGSVRVG